MVKALLQRLRKLDSRMGRIVHLRFVEGLTVEQTAAETGVSLSTVKSDSKEGKQWLRGHLEYQGLRASTNRQFANETGEQAPSCGDV